VETLDIKAVSQEAAARARGLAGVSSRRGEEMADDEEEPE